MKRFFKRLSQDQSDLRADSIRAWASSVEGATPIAAVEPRSVARVAGVVENVRVRPREGVPAFEATVDDGTGTVVAVWLGRRAIPGLSLGSRLILEGRVGGGSGRMQMMNPSFEFAPPTAPD
jgi:RecG-like helicase